MIQEFVDKFMKNKHILAEKFSKGHPKNYHEIVRLTVEQLNDKGVYSSISPDYIHSINYGSYSGTLLFVVTSAVSEYELGNCWYVKINYGSCCMCDVLQKIRGYENEKPNEEQVKDYLNLALNIVQNLKKME